MIQLILGIGAVISGIIGAIGYIPQIQHLLKIKNSSGISLLAWIIWGISNTIALTYAIAIKNAVFITLNTIFLVMNLTIVSMSIYYRKYK